MSKNLDRLVEYELAANKTRLQVFVWYLIGGFVALVTMLGAIYIAVTQFEGDTQIILFVTALVMAMVVAMSLNARFTEAMPVKKCPSCGRAADEDGKYEED